jgi:hypothetical protein
MATYATRAKHGLVRSLLWAGAGLLVGLVIGLALGWWVWPVQWSDTDPSDLREQHQIAYVQMVADSLAVNGEAQLAGQRLYELTEKDEDWRQVAALIEQTAVERETAGDMAAALRLRRLAEIVQLPAARAPAMTPVPAERPRSRSTVLLLGVGLAMIALAAAVWLVLHFARRPARQPKPGMSPVQDLVAARESAHAAENTGRFAWERLPRGAAPLAATAQQPAEARMMPVDLQDVPEAEQAVSLDLEEEEDDLWKELEEDEGEEVLLDEADDVVRAGARMAPLEDTLVAAAPPRALRSQAAARPRGSQAVWGEFETEYRLGDDDFYYAFTVESPEREFVGQCGIVIGDVLTAEQPQRVDAFDVWLFETQGSRTVTHVLVSPYAFEGEGQHAKLSRRGEVHLAQPGAMLSLQGTHLRLTVTVLDCLYVPLDEADEAVFSQLTVRMVVQPIA